MTGSLRDGERRVGQRTIGSVRLTLCAGCGLAGALLLALLPAPALAVPVLKLDHGHVRVEPDPALPSLAASSLPPPAGPSARPLRPARSGAGAGAGASGRRRTVAGELARLARAGAIPSEEQAALRADYTGARSTWRRLGGTRRGQLGAVIANLEAVARAGRLTASRVPALFETLRRNREWWSTGPLLAAGRRVGFSGSRLVWQYYPGQGIQLQMLGNWGKVNGYLKAKQDENVVLMLDELIPLAARRGSGIAWEYYFRFGGGVPPWTSALSQGTALQALSRAAKRLGDPSYLDVGRQALGLFREAPPTGVRVRTPAGAHYLIYSFAPGQRVLNGFIQSLNGLFDFADVSADASVKELFDDGEAQAERETPSYDTGAWSLYSQGGAESTLDYHVLLRDFLKGLCSRTDETVFCRTDERFTTYLKQPPALRVISRRARGGRTGAIRFRLSKVSRVGMTVLRGSTPVFSTSASVGHGTRSYSWRAPRVPGAYTVRLSAVDLSGNRGSATGTLEVLKPSS